MYILHHSKYIVICSIDAVADDLTCFEIDNLPSGKFFFHCYKNLYFLLYP